MQMRSIAIRGNCTRSVLEEVLEGGSGRDWCSRQRMEPRKEEFVLYKRGAPVLGCSGLPRALLTCCKSPEGQRWSDEASHDSVGPCGRWPVQCHCHTDQREQGQPLTSRIFCSQRMRGMQRLTQATQAGSRFERRSL